MDGHAPVAASLRRRAADAGSERGAAIVLDPATGDQLALVSQPAPDLARSGPVDDGQVLHFGQSAFIGRPEMWCRVVREAAWNVGTYLAPRPSCARKAISAAWLHP